MGCGENAEATWTRYKRCVLEAADEVCGWTKGGVRRSTTWWWNEDVKRVVRDKRNKFKAMLQRNTEESKEAYRAAKHEVRDRKSTRLNSSHRSLSRMPSSA